MPVSKVVNSEQWSVISDCLLFTVYCLLITGCAVTRPTLKIGLVAPFEGRYREVGYEVIYALRLAVREANAAGGVAGYSVELVSLDDSGDPQMAVEQARKLAADPQVLGVIGHWLDETTIAAASEYDEAGLPLLAVTTAPELPPLTFRLAPTTLSCRPSTLSPCPQTVEDLRLLGGSAENVIVSAPAPLPDDSADPAFAERYRAISNGVVPRFKAVLAYDAARLLLDAIARDVQANKTATRNGVAEALTRSNFAGLSGPIRFNTERDWAEPATWAYQWKNGEWVKP